MQKGASLAMMTAQDLTVRRGPNSLFAQLDVAPSVQPFTALRHLTLQPNGGVTAACIAALSSLQQLTALTTQMGVSNNVQEPVDLVEYAPLTGDLPRPSNQPHDLQAMHCPRA